MRILAGNLRGREIQQPKTAKVRPMSQKARAAIFDVVGDIAGWSVLDLCAGSGAVGLEALSRGAKQVQFIEQDPAIAKIIKANALALGVGEQTTVITWDAGHWARHHLKASFDLVVADPPYDHLDAETIDIAAKDLRPGGILVVSHTSKIEPLTLQSVSLVKTKVYGDTALSFYKR